MRSLLLSLLTTLSTVAFGAEYSALQEKLIVGRCHMDGCWWFSIEDAGKMGESKAGELFAIWTKRWSASCPRSKCGRKSFDGTATEFFFCSRTHPAWIGREDEKNPNKWTFQLLGPGSPEAFAGVWEGIHRMYWAACHGLDVTDPFDAKLGQRYGYPTRTLPKFHEDIDSFGKGFSNPFDILKLDDALGPQPAAEGLFDDFDDFIVDGFYNESRARSATPTNHCSKEFLKALLAWDQTDHAKMPALPKEPCTFWHNGRDYTCGAETQGCGHGYVIIDGKAVPTSSRGATARYDSCPKAPEEIQLTTLDNACQLSITANAPDAADHLSGPEAHRDCNGDLTIDWSARSGEFFSGGEGSEALAAQAIARACPSVAVVVYSGPTGGSQHWYIRRDKFAVRHSRDSGLPGDEDKYWNWEHFVSIMTLNKIIGNAG